MARNTRRTFLDLASDAFHLSKLRETAQRVHFDLPDSLAGETERSADFLQGLRLGPAEPVAQANHLALALRERG
jgi:hypothetical protein